MCVGVDLNVGIGLEVYICFDVVMKKCKQLLNFTQNVHALKVTVPTSIALANT